MVYMHDILAKKERKQKALLRDSKSESAAALS